MKIISWNVNGLRSVLKKGNLFFDFLKKENPDVLCLQETKAMREQVDLTLEDYPFQYWNSASKKGYSGTAVFSKVQPSNVLYDMGIPEHDEEGRVITLEFEDFYLVVVYTPNSQRGLARLDYRKKWDEDFLKHLKKLEASKPVVFAGDLNVAHTEIDLANPKANYNKVAGYTQTEIDGFQNYLDNGFVDTFREFDKSPERYTYWGYMFNARDKNIGWRIDYFCVSESLKPRVKDSFILPEVLGSDHCPVGIILD